MNLREETMTNHELHPLCTLFPRLTGVEFNALVADIRTNGLREPITLVDGLILDGGNRYRACLAAGVTPKFTKFDGDNLVTFVLSANLHRRHMTPGQQAAIVASAQDWAKANTHGGDRKSDQPATLPLDSVASRAKQSGAGERTQRMADKVARKSPELAGKVARGEISLPKAAKQIAPKTAKQVEKPEPANDEGPTLAELVDELQAENTRLTALIKASEADDLKAEAIKWRAAYDRALASQSEAMDAAARSEKREKFTMRQLMRCGKAVGEDDVRNIAAKVEAMARRKAAA
jgi:ParB-like chromosome segregation protein Spo0J